MKKTLPTPFDFVISGLYKSKARKQGPEAFGRKAGKLVQEFGLIDRLTSGCIVYRHNDPKTPADMRVKLAADGIVLLEVYFAEAPAIKLQVPIPLDEYQEGMELVVGPKVLPQLVQILLRRGSPPKPAAEEPPKMKLVLPG